MSNPQSLRNVSTINNDIRIARSPSTNSISSFGSFSIPNANNSNRRHLSSVGGHSPSAPQPSGDYILASATSRSRSRSNSFTPSRRVSLDNEALRMNEYQRQDHEEIINLMEKEQDAIVLKLMKEINSLKEENRNLKLQGNNAPSTSPKPMKRSLSLSHHNNKRKSSDSMFALPPVTGGVTTNAKTKTDENIILRKENDLLQKEVYRLQKELSKR